MEGLANLTLSAAAVTALANLLRNTNPDAPKPVAFSPAPGKGLTNMLTVKVKDEQSKI